jgi:uncharacterized protein YxjI
MSDVINKNNFLVKEHLGFFKAANNYDIYDPFSGEIILECREPSLSLITKLFRFIGFKTRTPFDIHIQTPGGERIVRIQRGWVFLLSKVVVTDENNNLIGRLKQKYWSLGGKFELIDETNQESLEVEAESWVGWNFAIRKNFKDIASISKKFDTSEFVKQMFTDADTYIVKISDEVLPNDNTRKLILGSVMCIDMVLNEGDG